MTALVSMVWTPYPYLETHPRDRLQGPSAQYWMGTDDQGRDILSRVMRGANTSLRVALLEPLSLKRRGAGRSRL